MTGTTAPPRAQSWVLLTALFTFASFLEIVLFSHLVAFTPLFLQNLNFDAQGIKVWTGVLASVGTGLGFWFVPFWGVLADRYGRKLLILRSFAIEAGATFLMALSSNLWLFLFGRAIIGLALGNTGLMFATVADTAPRERVGFAISIITGSQPLGGVIGSLIGGFLVSRLGVNVLWGFDGAMIALLVLLLWLTHRETFEPKLTHPVPHMLREALRAVVRTPVVVKLFTFSFLATAGFFFSYAYYSARILELARGGDPATTIGIVFGVSGIATLIATPLWGAAADKWGHRRLLPLVTILTALAYVPLYFADNLAQFTARLFLLSAVSPAVNSMTFAIVGIETPAERRGAVMSMVFMPINAAILFAPILAGFITREVRQVFAYSAALVFISFLLLALYRERATTTPPA